jgi:hypothetical protein
VRRDDDNDTVLYEVNLEADAAIERPFDTWLRDHVADMLQLPGFLSAEVFGDSSAPAGRIRRTVQYRMRNQAALEQYLREQAPAMRARGVALFGDKFTATRRTLAHREEFIRGAVSTENCLNCGEVLTGQHCAHCGQRARVRVLSLAGLLRDLLGDITNFDSRLWRTLRPLAFKPGQLTVDYLRGRRTYYSPPFRMYLILSVGFFVLASLGADPGGGIKLNVDGAGSANLQFTDDSGAGTPANETRPADSQPAPGAPAGAASPAAGGASTTMPPATPRAPKLDPDRQKIVDAILSRMPESERARARTELEREFGALTPEQVAPVKRVLDDPCGEGNFKVQGLGEVGRKYEPRLREACRKITGDSKTFGRALYENIPKMMFIFLPLIAAVMYVLYLGSGRYYVEHLLFFVHYHAFFFLGGLSIVLLDRLAGLMAATRFADFLRVAEGVVTAAFVLYVPYYLYRAMRRVYGQGRMVTLLKYSLLGIGYLFFLVVTGIGLLAYTALTL